MRTNKYIILITLPLTVSSLIVAYILNCCNESCFASNVFLGVFGSSLLTLMVGLVNYMTERQKTLEAFWSYGKKVIRNFNRYSADDDLDHKIDLLMQMNEYDYQPFEDAFGAICFLFNNKKARSEISKRIYGPIIEIRTALNDKYWHFKEYKKTSNGNRTVMAEFVSEIDQLLIKRETRRYIRDDGSEIVAKSSDTYKVHQLNVEYTDYYYFVMYPWKKKEAKTGAD